MDTISGAQVRGVRYIYCRSTVVTALKTNAHAGFFHAVWEGSETGPSVFGMRRAGGHERASKGGGWKSEKEFNKERCREQLIRSCWRRHWGDLWAIKKGGQSKSSVLLCKTVLFIPEFTEETFTTPPYVGIIQSETDTVHPFPAAYAETGFFGCRLVMVVCTSLLPTMSSSSWGIPGQLRYLISPACSGSTPQRLTSWTAP